MEVETQRQAEARSRASDALDRAWREISSAVDHMRDLPGTRRVAILHSAMRDIERVRDELYR